MVKVESCQLQLISPREFYRTSLKAYKRRNLAVNKIYMKEKKLHLTFSLSVSVSPTHIHTLSLYFFPPLIHTHAHATITPHRERDIIAGGNGTFRPCSISGHVPFGPAARVKALALKPQAFLEMLLFIYFSSPPPHCLHCAIQVYVLCKYL